MRKKIAAGNWKMNGQVAELAEISKLDQSLTPDENLHVIICPPATLISEAAALPRQTVKIGAQNCHQNTSGAHTGEISAGMIKNAGATYVILGHSERRADFNETDACVRDKTKAAWQETLCAIVCVGETLDERKAANTLDIIAGQMAGSIPDGATGENLIVAYEPVWAIGTGLTPSLEEIGEVHSFIRARLEQRFGEGVGRSVHILYGGSMKPENAAEISAIPHVDGGLVGGASLKASDFSKIAKAMQ